MAIFARSRECKNKRYALQYAWTADVPNVNEPDLFATRKKFTCKSLRSCTSAACYANFRNTPRFHFPSSTAMANARGFGRSMTQHSPASPVWPTNVPKNTELEYYDGLTSRNVFSASVLRYYRIACFVRVTWNAVRVSEMCRTWMDPTQQRFIRPYASYTLWNIDAVRSSEAITIFEFRHSSNSTIVLRISARARRYRFDCFIYESKKDCISLKIVM